MGENQLPVLLGITGLLVAVAIYFLWVRRLPKKD